MQKSLLVGLLFLSFLGCSRPSSEIPERREFPVNTKVSPCENFYEYACSEVNESFKLREDRSRHAFAFSDSSERILEFKKKYFLNLEKTNPESQREKELKNFYMACMNADSRKEEEKTLVQETQKQLSAIQTKKEIFDYFQRKIISSDFSWVGIGTISNQTLPDYNDLYLDTPLMTLPEKSYYEKEEVLKDFRELVRDFFVTLKVSDPEKKADLIVGFEKKVSEIYPTPQEFRVLITSNTYMSRADVIRKYPNLNLSSFFSEIPARAKIRNFVPKTLEMVNQTLQKFSLEELKTVYLYKSLNDYLDDAYPEYYQKKFDFDHQHLGGPEKRADRQERCTKITMRGFDREVDFILWKRMFPTFDEKKFIQMAEKIRGSILDSLEKNQWLSKGAKSEAISKMKKAKLQLVTPKTDSEWDFNPEANYSSVAPIQNSKKLALLNLKKDIDELNRPVDKDRWGMGPLIVNAYYSPSYNKFVLPIGILQYPFYDQDLPEEVNLGAIGAVMGHELGHGVDDKGSKYNADGILKSWMTKKDLTEFQKRGAILIDQFNQVGHNGVLTLGENIGDFVGVTASYRAAFSESPLKGEELKKRKQDFFLQYARVWCEVQRPKYAEYRLKSDPHSLGFARTNEQMKQQPAFQEAFGCKAGDAMVLPSEKRVEIW